VSHIRSRAGNSDCSKLSDILGKEKLKQNKYPENITKTNQMIIHLWLIRKTKEKAAGLA
jgi:hypothetical protein